MLIPLPRAFLLLLLGCGCAQLDLDFDPSLNGDRQNLWPLVYHEHRPATDDCEVSALASAIADRRQPGEHRREHRALPFWSYERQAERRDLRLLTSFYPSLWRSVVQPGESRQAVLEVARGYALAQRWSSRDYQEGYVLPLGWYQRDAQRGKGLIFPLHAFEDDGHDWWTVSAAGLYRAFGNGRWGWRDALPLFCQYWKEGRYRHFFSLPYSELTWPGKTRRLYLAGLLETKERPGGRHRARLLNRLFVQRRDDRDFVQELLPIYRIEQRTEYGYLSLGKFLLSYERDERRRSLRLLHFLNFTWQAS